MMNVPTPIAVGELVHVITRRMFEAEPRRHFVGRIVAAEALNVRLEGYAFVFDASQGGLYVKHNDLRTRVLNLADSGFIVNLLPTEAAVDAIRYEHSHNGRLVVTDGKSFSLPVQEFGALR